MSDATLIRDVRDCLGHVRPEATRLRDRGTTEDEAAEKISDSARSRWSTWAHPEWTRFAVRAFYNGRSAA
ncbi:hypothetical protein ACIGW8_01515 [Streptomyces sioyaensis]|uniref:hypothetical protein n=1 Tax=Streptomyces sioyaensis TaxID=67364 RepID=UPI0037D10295